MDWYAVTAASRALIPSSGAPYKPPVHASVPHIRIDTSTVLTAACAFFPKYSTVKEATQVVPPDAPPCPGDGPRPAG